MPRRRSLKLQEYGISPTRAEYLRSFCRQYPEMKEQLANIRNAYNSPCITGLPGGNDISNPVCARAIKAAELSKKLEVIEQSCIEADSGIYQYLLKNVTLGISYEKMYPSPPCCKDHFYRKRRKFYAILDEKLKVTYFGDVLS